MLCHVHCQLGERLCKHEINAQESIDRGSLDDIEYLNLALNVQIYDTIYS